MILLSLVSLAHAQPPAFRLEPVTTPDGPGVATVWSAPGGQPFAALVSAGTLGISDGWLKWFRAGWDEPMEVPFAAWEASPELHCQDIVYDAGDGFSGTETELCDTVAYEATLQAHLDLLASVGIVGPDALVAADAAARELVLVLSLP